MGEDTPPEAPKGPEDVELKHWDMDSPAPPAGGQPADGTSAVATHDVAPVVPLIPGDRPPEAPTPGESPTAPAAGVPDVPDVPPVAEQPHEVVAPEAQPTGEVGEAAVAAAATQGESTPSVPEPETPQIVRHGSPALTYEQPAETEKATPAPLVGNDVKPTGEEPAETNSLDHPDDRVLPEDEGRWDKQKAATIGAALNQEDAFNDRTTIHNDFIKEVNERKVIDSDQPERGPFLHPFDVKEIADSKNRLDEKADAVMAPYVELYDLNPEKFAKMPTEEFMEIAKPLAKATGTIEYHAEHLAELEPFRQELAKGLEKEELIDPREARSFGWKFGTYLANDAEEKFDAISRSSFQQTGQQMMEAYQKLADEYLGKIEVWKKAAEQRRQEIIDAHKPEPEPTNQPPNEPKPVDQPVDQQAA